MPFTRAFFLKNVDALRPFEGDLFSMAWAALLIPFVAWNVAQPSGRRDQLLGNFSYSLYLVHWPVIFQSRALLPHFGIVEKSVCLCAVLAISVVFYVLIDRRSERLRQRVVGRPSVPAATPL